MKLFYRNIVAVGVFLTVMLMIVGTASADSVMFATEVNLPSNGITCCLLAVDTDGIGVEAAAAGGVVSADCVKN